MARRSFLMTLLAAACALEDGSASFYESLQHGTADNATAKRTLLTSYVWTTGARCLDGTPGVYYHRKGVGSEAAQILR